MTSQLKAMGSDVCVARVVSEDKDFITLEVMKHDDDTFTLNEGDQFLTVLFIKMENNQMQAWKPWQ